MTGGREERGRRTTSTRRPLVVALTSAAAVVGVVAVVAAVSLESRGSHPDAGSAAALSAPRVSPSSSTVPAVTPLPGGTPTAEAVVVVKVHTAAGHVVLSLYDEAECDAAGAGCLVTFDTSTGVITRGRNYAGRLGACPTVGAHPTASGVFVQPPSTTRCPQGLRGKATHGIAPGTVGWLVDGSPTGPYFESVDGVHVGPTAPPSPTPNDTSFPAGGVPTADAVLVVQVDADAHGRAILILYDPGYCPFETTPPPLDVMHAAHSPCLTSFDTATGAIVPAGTYSGSTGGCSRLPQSTPTDQPSAFVVDPVPTAGCPQLSQKNGVAPGSTGWLVAASPNGPYFESLDGKRLGPAYPAS